MAAGMRQFQEHSAETALHESEERLRAIFDVAPIPMLLVDKDAVVWRANGAAARLAGAKLASMIGSRGGEALNCVHHYEAPDGCGTGVPCAGCALRRAAMQTIETNAGASEVLLSMDIAADLGTPKQAHLLVTTAPVGTAGDCMALVYLQDVTEQKAREEALHRATRYDALTGLANRQFFVEQVTDAVERSRREEHFRFVVAVLDLDDFRHINSRFGQSAGDLMLAEIGRRLIESSESRRQRGECEYATCGRLGGDEMAILLGGVSDATLETRLAADLLPDLSRPMRHDGADVRISARVGVASGSSQAADADGLIGRAEAAVYGLGRAPA
jgi:diguanylate cyclase (GGDEF)-like protein